MVRKMNFLYMFITVGLLTLLILSFSGEKGYFDLNILKAERESLIEKNKKLAGENMRLFYEVQLLKKDPAYIEDVARRELGMVAGDEIILKFPNGVVEER